MIANIVGIVVGSFCKMKQGNENCFALIYVVELGGSSIETRLNRNPLPWRSALSAVVFLRIMKRTIGSIAVTVAMSVIASGRRSRMTNEQFEREMRYRVSMAAATCMLRKGLITQAEHDIFNRLMTEKHRPMIGDLLLKTSVDKHLESS
jgi:hypothetical protein